MVGRHSRTLSIDPLPSGIPERPGINARAQAPLHTGQGGPDGPASAAGVDNRDRAVGPSLSPSPAGGFTRAQLEAVGVSWPPPKGWKKALEARAGGAAAGLENPMDNSTGADLSTDPRFASKYAVLDELRKFTSIAGQRTCMSITRAASVTVGRRAGAAMFGSALPCGRRFCPNCGPRLQAARRDDLRDTVAAARARGWGVYFLTLTLSHSTSDRLADLLDGLDSSLRALLGGGFFTRLKRRHGIRHYVRVTETQAMGENGWHPHFHLLLFVDPAAARDFSKFDLQDALLDEWLRVVDAAGYRASRRGNLLLEPTDEHLTRMAAYFSKQMAESLAWEMSGQMSKRGKNGSLNPAQLLLLACAGDAKARELWVELEEATKGRRQIAWSLGIRSDLRLPPPADGDALLREENVVEPAEALVTVPREAWEDHAFRAGFRADLEAVVVGATEASEVLWWLHDRGITAALAQPPGPRSPVAAIPGPSDRPWLALPDEHGGF